MSQTNQQKGDDLVKATAENVVEFLRQYDVKEEYKWPLDKNTQSRAHDLLGIQLSGKGNYEETTELSAKLRARVASCQDFESTLQYAEFVILDWGKVGKRKKDDGSWVRSEKLEKRLRNLYEEKDDDLRNSKSIRTLTDISSWSKYLSILRPDAAIYDSRVAFSINAINLDRGEVKEFFRMPSSASHRSQLISPEFLFLLEAFKDGRLNVEKVKWEEKRLPSTLRKKYSQDSKVVYKNYLSVLESVVKELDRTKQDIEMLLFALAPTVLLRKLVEYASKVR